MYNAGLTISCSTGLKTESILTAGEIADRDATAAAVVNQEGVVHFGEVLAGYAQGAIIRGGATYWEVHDARTNHFILVGDGTDIVSKAFGWDDIAAGAGADMVHNHGSAAEGGVVLGPLDSITMADDAWIGIGVALERIVFDAAGSIGAMGCNFGIHTITPNNVLQVKTTTNANGITIQRASSDDGSHSQLSFLTSDTDDAAIPTYIRVYRRTAWNDNDMEFYVGGTVVMYLDDDGSITIADLGGGGNQDVGADNVGLLYVPFVSDRKFKDNIKPLAGGLEAVRGMRAVTFDWNVEELAKVGLDFGESGQQVGLVAQEVQAAAPLAGVHGSKWESYSNKAVLGYLLEAVKANDARLTQGGL